MCLLAGHRAKVRVVTDGDRPAVAGLTLPNRVLRNFENRGVNWTSIISVRGLIPWSAPTSRNGSRRCGRRPAAARPRCSCGSRTGPGRAARETGCVGDQVIGSPWRGLGWRAERPALSALASCGRRGCGPGKEPFRSPRSSCWAGVAFRLGDAVTRMGLPPSCQVAPATALWRELCYVPGSVPGLLITQTEYDAPWPRLLRVGWPCAWLPRAACRHGQLRGSGKMPSITSLPTGNRRSRPQPSACSPPGARFRRSAPDLTGSAPCRPARAICAVSLCGWS